MNKSEIEVIKNFAKSSQWDIVKDNLLLPALDNIKDVSQPLKIDGENIEASEAYLAKSLAAKKLKSIIRFIDTLDSKKSNTLKKEDFI